MDHPNIAKVLDAGATDTGRPFFVMELVRGVTITAYCDENDLPTESRLDLFLHVCHAIQHAHQKGIIHRDVKPSNILVTLHDGVPVPKVIDFGIAKATGQQRLSDHTLFTAFAQFLGTPAYMSPEQAELSGLDIDTRSDIYSLGVLLYELLTDKTPFDSKDLVAAGLDAMRRTIREQEPPKPSTRLSTMVSSELAVAAKRRQTDPPKLIHKVRGDLDWIVMKTLEKDRKRRYETVSGLAMDIQRHLKHEAVSAAAPSALYRSRKFVRRHRVALGTGGAILTLLMAGVVGSTWQAVRATRAERTAKTALHRKEQAFWYLRRVLQGLPPFGRDAAKLREFMEQTYEGLKDDLKDDPNLAAEMVGTIAQVYWTLGDYERAEGRWRETLTILRSSLGQEHRAVATALDGLGIALQSRGKMTEAESAARDALAMRRKLLDKADPEIATSLNNLALILRVQGRLTEAEAFQREELALSRRLLGEQHPELASSLGNLALTLWNQGKFAEAETMHRESLAIQIRALGPEHSYVATSLNNLALVLRDQGKFAEAETTVREALAVQRRTLAGAEHPEVASFLDTLALVLRDERKFAEAEATHREVLAMQKRLLGTEHPDVAQSLDSLAIVLRDRDALADAEAMHREALVLRRKVLSNDHPDLAVSLSHLALVLSDEGKLAEAEGLLREYLAIREKQLPEDWPTFDARSRLGGVLLQQGRLGDAESLLISGCEGMWQRQDRMPANAKVNLKESLRRLVQFHESKANSGKALEWRQRLMDLDKVGVGTSPSAVPDRRP